MDKISELESAILAQANRLAGEYRERAEQSRENILREARERLHLREEREVLLAKARAERAYRRMVQSNELQLQREMDHLRWNLVEGVRERMAERMRRFMQREPEPYRALLQALLTKGVEAIERERLTAMVNQQDLKWLQPTWQSFSAPLTSDRQIELSATPIDTLGGILVLSEDNRIRVDNTFEGRMERLQSSLQQVIIERLLPEGR